MSGQLSGHGGRTLVWNRPPSSGITFKLMGLMMPGNINSQNHYWYYLSKEMFKNGIMMCRANYHCQGEKLNRASFFFTWNVLIWESILGVVNTHFHYGCYLINFDNYINISDKYETCAYAGFPPDQWDFFSFFVEFREHNISSLASSTQYQIL